MFRGARYERRQQDNTELRGLRPTSADFAGPFPHTLGQLRSLTVTQPRLRLLIHRAKRGRSSCPSNCNHRQAEWGKGSRSASSPRSRRADDARIDLVTAFARFLERHPAYSATGALDELRASEYGRLESQEHSYLDYTGGWPLRRLANPGARTTAQRARVRQSALCESEFDRHDAAGRTDACARCSPSSTARDEYTAIFTLNASGALKLVGESYPFEAGRALAVDGRQSQLGQRHPRVRARERRHRRLRSADRARTFASTPPPWKRSLPRPTRRAPTCFAYPGAVEFLRREASARAHRRRARPRLARASRCGGVRADQPPRSARGDARFRDDLVLQDVRLSHRRRLPADPQCDAEPRFGARGLPAAP